MTEFSNKKFCILGLGISGLASLKFLLELVKTSPKVSSANPQIFISDTRAFDSLHNDVQQLLTKAKNQSRLDYEFGLPHSTKCFDCDYLLISPGISPQDAFIQEAKQKQIQVLTEVEFGTHFVKDYICITGTNGKSTVTAWTASLLSGSACGNIGVPLLQALNQPSTFSPPHVIETSSFMLAHSHHLKPKVAAITNVTPDHIAWHGGWQEYFKAKLTITLKQNSDDWLILPYEEQFKQLETKAQVIWALAPNQELEPNVLGNFVFVNKQKIICVSINGQVHELCETSKLKLVGEHNLSNAMFASAIGFAWGMPASKIQERLGIFAGLEHRLEFVKDIQGNKYFNDSKATNPESSIVALNAFPQGKVLWLAGGRDKNTCLQALCQSINKHCSAVFLYGEAQQRFAKTLEEHKFSGQIILSDNLSDSLKEAQQYLSKQCGFTVLLSPACASFDQYKSFEARGDHFKQLVNELEGK
jgi:UDP-N-acetylmuramoylalanine--D-glutamate ligase